MIFLVALLYFGLLLLFGGVGAIGLTTLGIASLVRPRPPWIGVYVRSALLGAVLIAAPLTVLCGSSTEMGLFVAWCFAGAGLGLLVLWLRRHIDADAL